MSEKILNLVKELNVLYEYTSDVLRSANIPFIIMGGYCLLSNDDYLKYSLKYEILSTSDIDIKIFNYNVQDSNGNIAIKVIPERDLLIVINQILLELYDKDLITEIHFDTSKTSYLKGFITDKIDIHIYDDKIHMVHLYSDFYGISEYDILNETKSHCNDKVNDFNIMYLFILLLDGIFNNIYNNRLIKAGRVLARFFIRFYDKKYVDEMLHLLSVIQIDLLTIKSSSNFSTFLYTKYSNAINDAFKLEELPNLIEQIKIKLIPDMLIDNQENREIIFVKDLHDYIINEINRMNNITLENNKNQQEKKSVLKEEKIQELKNEISHHEQNITIKHYMPNFEGGLIQNHKNQDFILNKSPQNIKETKETNGIKGTKETKEIKLTSESKLIKFQNYIDNIFKLNLETDDTSALFILYLAIFK